MTSWEIYPSAYRRREVKEIYKAVQAGDCASVIGLSGSGKSNLLGFINHRGDVFPLPTALIDCNRLREPTLDGFFQLIRSVLGDRTAVDDELYALDSLLKKKLYENEEKYTLLFDRFELLAHQPEISSNLRALRDIYKYKLTYVTATRRSLETHSELAELFYNHTLWLGPLSESDTLWNVTSYAERVGEDWNEAVAQQIYELTRGYPSLLRAVCEAHAGGTDLELTKLRTHPAIQKRLEEFWSDNPSPTDIQNTGLDGLLLLEHTSPQLLLDPTQLTEKEFALLEYFQTHPDDVCTKDEIVRAVWPEDHIYERGIRDDSLAQLVRRLRVKIESDPSNPRHILTVPGRGYRFIDEAYT